MGGRSGGYPPGEKKSDFLFFSAQNGLFQLKWQQNMEYILIFFANKGGYPPFGAEWGRGFEPPLAETLYGSTPIINIFTLIVWGPSLYIKDGLRAERVKATQSACPKLAFLFWFFDMPIICQHVHRLELPIYQNLPFITRHKYEI